jgi:hypothetical protein
MLRASLGGSEKKGWIRVHLRVPVRPATGKRPLVKVSSAGPTFGNSEMPQTLKGPAARSYFASAVLQRIQSPSAYSILWE